MKIGLIAISGVHIENRSLASLGVSLPGFVKRGKNTGHCLAIFSDV